MPIVVDASAALSLVLEDEHQAYGVEALKQIIVETAIVPPIFWPEVCNALLVNERRGRLDLAATTEYFSELKCLPMSVASLPIDQELLKLAREHRITSYDATYLQLAIINRTALATLDSELAAAASRTGIDLVYPTVKMAG